MFVNCNDISPNHPARSNLHYRPSGMLFTSYLVDDDIRGELKQGMVISFQFTKVTNDGTPIRPFMYLPYSAITSVDDIDVVKDTESGMISSGKMYFKGTLPQEGSKVLIWHPSLSLDNLPRYFPRYSPSPSMLPKFYL